MKSINPSTGDLIKEYETMTEEELDEIVHQSTVAQKKWRKVSLQKKSSVLEKVGEALESRKEELARLVAKEMGKPLPQGLAEIEKCAWVCNYYAEHAGQFLEDQIIATDATKSYVTFQPLGTILAIMPWNFPFWQVFRFAIPSLIAGNAGILKHSSNVSGCALAIEEVLHEGGVPEDVFRTILADSSQAEALIEHDGIAAVTLTGSSWAGKAVAKKAGSVLKKSVLELGGSDPYIILHDAHVEESAKTCVNSRLINSGQSCIAAKRFIVVEENYETFLDIITREMKNRKVGDPFDAETEVGPLARKDLRDDLHGQVKRSIEAGAECVLGGEIPDGEGAFYPPTILVNVTEDMPAYHEELFGPVAAVIKVRDEKEAIRVANDTEFGLGAAIFSKDFKHAEKLAVHEIQAGSCFINEYVKSDPRLPFGGVKNSGFGRELSHFGIEEFVNIKTIYRA